MLSFIISLIGILITLIIVIGFHEFGHFIMARLMGAKVLRFSIGFGKILKSWQDKKGTEYTLALIPLGGFVKMLDENEGEVPESEKAFAYNRLPLYRRMAIVIAGPLFNLLLAFIIYWIIFWVGYTTVAPIIGKITPNSIAAKANMKSQQEILSIDNHPTPNWIAVSVNMLKRAGDKNFMHIQTQNPINKNLQNYQINLNGWQLDELRPDALKSFGIEPFNPTIPAIIGKISSGDPAAKSFLNPGDKIISLNNKPINDWITFITIISENPEKTIPIIIQRSDKLIKGQITIGFKRDLFFKKHGYFGVTPQFIWPSYLIRNNKYNFLQSIPYAWEETKNFTYLNFLILGKMLTGKISLQSLGGPITIFESAGTALNHGIITFGIFLAFLSISIGVINILPIPGLDGGHLLFQIIEAIIRRPVSIKLQLLFFRLGMILLLLILTQAIINDLMRL